MDQMDYGAVLPPSLMVFLLLSLSDKTILLPCLQEISQGQESFDPTLCIRAWQAL